jgi:hypothetical protein
MDFNLRDGYVSDTDIPKKRKRVEDQIATAIVSKIDHSKSIVRASGELRFSCVSRNSFEIHNVIIGFDDNNKMCLTCECSKRIGSVSCGKCIHLNKCLVHICRQFIEQSTQFRSEAEQKIKELDELFDNISL